MDYNAWEGVTDSFHQETVATVVAPPTIYIFVCVWIK